MRNHKLLLIISVLLVIDSISVFGLTYTEYSPSPDTQEGYASTQYSDPKGIQFIANNSVLDRITLKLRKAGTPTGYIRFALFTDNSNQLGSLLVNNTGQIDVSTLSTTFTDYNITMTGITGLTNGTKYWITIWEADSNGWVYDTKTGMFQSWSASAYGLYDKYGTTSYRTTYYPRVIYWWTTSSPASSDNFLITANNNYNSSNILNFNVTITNGTSYNYGTTNGTITTSILQNSTKLWNITFYGATNIFNKTYTNINVSNNFQSNLSQYPILYLKNKWNNSNLSIFNATINSVNYGTASSFLYTPLNNSYSVLTYAVNYINTTNTKTLIENTINYINVSQSIINISIKNIIDNTTFSNYTIYFNSTLFCDTTTTNCLNYPNAGAYIINVTSKDGSFKNFSTNTTITALQNNTIYFYGVEHYLNITAKNVLTNASIINFSVNIKSLNTSYVANYSTTNGTILTPVTHNTYNVTIDAEGYALYNNVQYISVVNDTNTTFYLQQNNGVAITIYNEVDGSLLNATEVTIYTYLNNATLISTNTTNTSQINFYDFTPGNYTFRFEATGYVVKEYYVSISNRSFQTLNAYMLQSTYSTIFSFLDENNGNTIEGVAVTIKRYINGSLVVISSLTSDITGRIQFSYEQSTPYYFTCTKTDYTTKEFILNPIIFSSYNVKLTPTTTQTYESDYSGVSITYTPKYFNNGQKNSLSFTFGSPQGILNVYGFNVSYKGISNASTGTNAYGEVLSTNINISGASFQDTALVTYYYTTSDGATNRYSFNMEIVGQTSSNYTIFSNKGQTYGLGDFERVLIVSIILLLVVGAGTMFSGAFIGGVLGMFVLGFFAYMGFISWWASYPTMIFLFIYIVWGSSK